MAWYVVYTNNGNESEDGPFSEMEAELHVIRCEFEAHGINYEIVERGSTLHGDIQEEE